MSVDKIHPVESGLDYFDDEELENLYTWIDSIPLSRPKKNVARDFADGVLVSEIMYHKFPHLVQKHNYSTANSTSKKMENWLYMNRKVFKKLNFELSDALIRDLVNAKPGTIELLLRMLKRKIEMAEWEMKRNPPQRHAGGRRNESDQPEADQNIGSPGRSRKGVSPTRGGGGYFKRHADSKEVVTLDKLLRPSNYTEKPKQRRIPAHLTEANSVPRLLFEDKVQECLAKDETIEFLKAKVRRLERLIQLKDVRIDDLQNRVESMRPTGNLKR